MSTFENTCNNVHCQCFLYMKCPLEVHNTLFTKIGVNDPKAPYRYRMTKLPSKVLGANPKYNFRLNVAHSPFIRSWRTPILAHPLPSPLLLVLPRLPAPSSPLLLRLPRLPSSTQTLFSIPISTHTEPNPNSSLKLGKSTLLSSRGSWTPFFEHTQSRFLFQGWAFDIVISSEKWKAKVSRYSVNY